jgi:hypothetical protein
MQRVHPLPGGAVGTYKKSKTVWGGFADLINAGSKNILNKK